MRKAVDNLRSNAFSVMEASLSFSPSRQDAKNATTASGMLDSTA
jgi:hypothetical protein